MGVPGDDRGSGIDGTGARFLDGLTHAAVAIRVYFETRATPPLAVLDFYLYWDAGTFAPGAVTVATMQVDVLACSAVGTCP